MNKVMIFIVAAMVSLSACDMPIEKATPQAASGVHQTQVAVSTQANGLTIEQQNVRDRILNDNRVGAIKHLYVISAYSGQVLLYSTVRGKVTSSGKRLTPRTVSAIAGQGNSQGSFIPTELPGRTPFHDYATSEVLEDDGTYGNSVEYIYWWDTKGNYHQQYITGGMILHVSDVPLAVKSVTIRVDQEAEK
jgi:hypothetical protein